MGVLLKSLHETLVLGVQFDRAFDHVESARLLLDDTRTGHANWMNADRAIRRHWFDRKFNLGHGDQILSRSTIGQILKSTRRGANAFLASNRFNPGSPGHVTYVVKITNLSLMAERSGFEPENSYYTVTHLAGGRFRPLSHLSAGLIITSSVAVGAGLVRFLALLPHTKSLLPYLILVVFSIAGMAATRFFHLDPGPIPAVAAVLIVVLGACAAFESALEVTSWKRVLAGAGAVVLLGLTVEVVGLYTGLPFGRYHYTDQWVPTVLLPGDQRFPLLLPIAWLMVAGASYLVTCNLREVVARPLAAAALATVVDVVMENVFARPGGYWVWEGGSVPLMNYIGWFVTSLLAALILQGLKVRVTSARWPAIVLGFYVLLVLVQYDTKWGDREDSRMLLFVMALCLVLTIVKEVRDHFATRRKPPT